MWIITSSELLLIEKFVKFVYNVDSIIAFELFTGFKKFNVKKALTE